MLLLVLKCNVDEKSKSSQIGYDFLYSKSMHIEHDKRLARQTIGFRNTSKFAGKLRSFNSIYYYSNDMIVQQLPVQANDDITEVKIRKWSIIVTVTTVAIHEIVRIGGKVDEMNGEVLYNKIFDKPQFRDFI